MGHSIKGPLPDTITVASRLMGRMYARPPAQDRYKDLKVSIRRIDGLVDRGVQGGAYGHLVV